MMPVVLNRASAVWAKASAEFQPGEIATATSAIIARGWRREPCQRASVNVLNCKRLGFSREVVIEDL